MKVDKSLYGQSSGEDKGISIARNRLKLFKTISVA
jgi:hypothetical protein